jgi:predicted nucleotidyltransferase
MIKLVIDDKEKDKITIILEKHGVKKASVFGSYARGDEGDDSDIDLLVDLPDEYSLLDVAGLKVDLEEGLGRRVDLVEYGNIKSNIRDRVLKDKKVIYDS